MIARDTKGRVLGFVFDSFFGLGSRTCFVFYCASFFLMQNRADNNYCRRVMDMVSSTDRQDLAGCESTITSQFQGPSNLAATRYKDAQDAVVRCFWSTTSSGQTQSKMQREDAQAGPSCFATGHVLAVGRSHRPTARRRVHPSEVLAEIKAIYIYAHNVYIYIYTTNSMINLNQQESRSRQSRAVATLAPR